MTANKTNSLTWRAASPSAGPTTHLHPTFPGILHRANGRKDVDLVIARHPTRILEFFRAHFLVRWHASSRNEKVKGAGQECAGTSPWMGACPAMRSVTQKKRLRSVRSRHQPPLWLPLPQQLQVVRQVHKKCITSISFPSHKTVEIIENISVVYKVVKTGTECNRVTTQEECIQAAQKLGLAVTANGGEIVTLSTSGRIPYCWYAENSQTLLYNTNGASSFACGEFNAQWWCICTTPTTNTNSTTAIATTTTSSVTSTTTSTATNTTTGIA